MFEWLEEATSLLETGIAILDPSQLSAEEAIEALGGFARAGRLCAAGITLCAGRIAETSAHLGKGKRTPAEVIASLTGGSIGDAIAIVSVAGALGNLKALGEALRGGQLSPAQASAVAGGAGEDTDAEQRLLQAAATQPLKRLKDKARDEKARRESADEAEERLERLHKQRSLNTRVGPDGEVRGEFMLPPVAGARFVSAIENELKVILDEAARSGEEGTRANFRADALAALALRKQGQGRGRTEIVLVTDLSAFRRGTLQDEEICVIRGIGPVPMSVARELLGDAFLKLVVRRGADIAHVTHLGRTIFAHQRTALEIRDPSCVVPGCDASIGLEIDHWQIDNARFGPTALWNLARLCKFHHRLRTHRGWRLSGGPGKWAWHGPDESGEPCTGTSGAKGAPGDPGTFAAGSGSRDQGGQPPPGRGSEPSPGHDSDPARPAHEGASSGARSEASRCRSAADAPTSGPVGGASWRLFDLDGDGGDVRRPA